MELAALHITPQETTISQKLHATKSLKIWLEGAIYISTSALFRNLNVCKDATHSLSLIGMYTFKFSVF